MIKKHIHTTFYKFINEEKITPEYLKIDNTYIDSGGNIIGGDLYKINDYEKYDYISEKTHSFLINWSWSSDNLHFYQTHGLDAIDDDIIEELSQWKQKTPITLYRAVCDKNEELKHKNKLKSYFKNIKAAEMLLDDMDCKKTGGYIFTKMVNPEDILVDITLIPNYSDLDLIDEVIVIEK